MVRQVRISYLHVLRSEHEDNYALKATRRAKIMSAFVLRLLLRVWWAKTRRAQIEPHG